MFSIIRILIREIGQIVSVLGALSFEQTKLVSNLCNHVMGLDGSVALVSMINRHGRTVESKTRADLPFSGLTKYESDLINMQRVLQMQMTKDFDDKLGSTTMSIIRRNGCTECIFPFYDGVIFVIFSSTKTFEQTAERISTAIQEFNFDIATKNVAC